MSKKVVLKLQIHDDKEKQKALKTVSSLSGIESIAMDMKDKKLTVVGEVDPIQLVSKLRKLWPTDILIVGPAKEAEKKKDEEKKDDAKKDDTKKEEEQKKKELEQIAELLKLYKNNYNVNPLLYTQHYHAYSAEENPNSCVIC